MEERLQKILARAGVASRRAAEVAISQGRVSVNGQTVTEPGTKADAERDEIRVDGARLQAPAAPVYLLLNKPKGYVSTREDPTFVRAIDSIRSVLGLRQPVMVTVRHGRRSPTRLHARLSEIKSR